MNVISSCASLFLHLRRGLLLAGGTALLSVSCNSTAPVADGNVFVPGQNRYGYGSPQQAGPTGQGPRVNNSARTDRAPTTTGPNRRPPVIKRNPSDTTVDVTPPEPIPDKQESANPPASDPTPSVASDPAPASDAAPVPEPEPKPKPAAAREDLPFGLPVVGKKGFVYSPYAADKGQVDVQDIPAGTKVKCPYTEKTFRVP